MERPATADETAVETADETAVETPAEPERPPRPYAALCSALAHTRLRCEQLTYALVAGQTSGAESLAQDCVHYWLVAAAALRRLEQASAGRDGSCEAARRAVSRTAIQLLSLLDRGADAADPPARSGFAELRTGVELVMTERETDRQPALPRMAAIAASAARTRSSR